MVCQKCGNQLNPGDQFCMKCGTPVEATAPDVPVVDQAPVAAPVVNPFGSSLPPAPVAPAPTTYMEPVMAPQPAPQTFNDITAPVAPVAPVGNPTQFAQPVNQMNPITPQKTSKKGLFIGLAVGAAVLLIALVGFLMYFFSGPVAFARNSELLTGSNYSLRMPKGWDSAVKSGVLTVFETNGDSNGAINKGGISYADAKSEVDSTLNGKTKISSKKESTISDGKTYVVDGSLTMGGETFSYSSYLMYNSKEDKSSWLLLLSQDKKILDAVTGDAQYILASLKIDSPTNRGLETSPDSDTVEGIFSNVDLN